MIRPIVLLGSMACLSACAALAPESDLASAESVSRTPSIESESWRGSHAAQSPESDAEVANPVRSAAAIHGPAEPPPAEPSFEWFDSELQTQGGWAAPSAQAPVKKSHPTWKPGQAYLQGFFGAAFMDQVDLHTSSNGTIENNGQTTMPVIGGGGQWKLSGDNVDFGLEGMFSFAWQSNATAVAVGSGGAAVAVDFGLTIIDLYGGPFLSMFLGDKTRVYIAGGPILEWANYDPAVGSGNASSNGFGAGGYARTGIEFVLGSDTMLGLGVRWSKSSISMSGSYGNLDLEGVQALLTVTRGF